MRTALVMTALLALAVAARAQDAEQTQADQIKLSLTIALRHGPPIGEALAEDAPPDTVFLEGEPVDVAFTVTNVGGVPFEYADRNYDRSGRMPEYAVQVTDAAGQRMEDPRGGGGGMNGISGPGEIGPGESFTKHIWLNEWVMPLVPGHYTVAGVCGVWPFGRGPKVPPISSPPIEIEVLARTDDEMAAWVDELGAEVVAAAEMAREAMPHLPDPWLNRGRWLMRSPRSQSSPGAAGPAGPAGADAPTPAPDPARVAAKQMHQARTRAKPAVRYLGFTGSDLALPYLIETFYGALNCGSDGFMYMRNKRACEDFLLAALDERGATSTGQYLLRDLGVPDERTLPRTLAWLADVDPARRADAATALGWHRNSGGVPVDALIGALDDEDAKVRRAVVYALSGFRTDDVTAALLAASHDADENVRAAAAHTLRWREGDAVTPRLREMLLDVTQVALPALDALVGFDTPEATAAMRAGLDATDQDFRLEVALLLLRAGDDSVRGVLADALESGGTEMAYRLTGPLSNMANHRGLEHPDVTGNLEVARLTWIPWLREPVEEQ